MQFCRASELRLHKGEIFIYPTEAVYGIGACAGDILAVKNILKLKHRSWKQGLILVASKITHLDFIVDWKKLLQQLAVSHNNFNLVNKNSVFDFLQNQAHTYLLPVKLSVSKYIRGEFIQVAIRISQHPIVRELCDGLDCALISTSCNTSGSIPATSLLELKQIFTTEELTKANLHYCVKGNLGQEKKVSKIINLVSGKVIRQ